LHVFCIVLVNSRHKSHLVPSVIELFTAPLQNGNVCLLTGLEVCLHAGAAGPLLLLPPGVLLWRLEKDDPRDHDKQWVLHEKEKSWQQPELLARGKLPGVSAHLIEDELADSSREAAWCNSHRVKLQQHSACLVLLPVCAGPSAMCSMRGHCVLSVLSQQPYKISSVLLMKRCSSLFVLLVLTDTGTDYAGSLS
jgi:hypothetical protein